jgi:hypothetical protein
MFPTFCGAIGLAGWLVMLLVWVGLVSLMVWGIARLFPDHPRTTGPAVSKAHNPDDAPKSLVESTPGPLPPGQRPGPLARWLHRTFNEDPGHRS